jgi:hypothetical protein
MAKIKFTVEQTFKVTKAQAKLLMDVDQCDEDFEKQGELVASLFGALCSKQKDVRFDSLITEEIK